MVFKRVLGYFFLGVVILLLLLALVWSLNRYDVIKLPEYVLNIFEQKNQNEVTNVDEMRFYEYLESRSTHESDIEYVTLGVDNVKAFISAINTRDTYYWDCETEYFYDANSVLYSYNIWVDKDTYRIDMASNFSNLSTVYKDGIITTKDNLSGEVYTTQGDNDISLNKAVNIADVEFLLYSDDTVVEEAKLITAELEKYLYVRFFTEKLNKTDELYVSIDSGLVMFAVSTIDGSKTFSQKTNEFRLDELKNE